MAQAMMIKTGMNNKQMKPIAMNNIAKKASSGAVNTGGTTGLQGAKPMSVPGTKYKRKTNVVAEDTARYGAEDRSIGLKSKKKMTEGKECKSNGMKKKGSSIKMSGSFEGKSNKLGQGGRAAQLRAQGVPGGVIGNLARRAQAAPGQRNFHKRKK